MFRFQRLSHQGSVQLALVLVAVGTWLSGCGDDEEGTGGKGGTSGTAGNAGAVTGGNAGSPTGGTGGSPTGGAAGSTNAGSGGTPMAGSGGNGGGTGGDAGSAGSGAEGGAGMGGEGGIGEGGMGGTAGTTAGMGGEGGSTEATCATGDLSFMELDGMQAHDHLPITGMERTAILGMINTGAPLVFTTPEEGGTPHTHTLTFTAAQLTTLRNGGTIASIESSMGGPAANMHTHTYSIECAP